jgi:hypothetical protein
MDTIEKEKQERKERAANQRIENILTPRAGMSSSSGALQEVKLEVNGIELSDITWIDPNKLLDNDSNPYLPLLDNQINQLSDDIREKGILVPLVAYQTSHTRDYILLCGHNRKKAALTIGLKKVPVQVVTSELTEKLKLQIMKSENDLRRGGNWSAVEKKEFIAKHFSNVLDNDNRGGDRKSEISKEAPKETKALSAKIAESSRGQISNSQAKKYVSQIKKETGLLKRNKAKSQPESIKQSWKKDTRTVTLKFPNKQSFEMFEKAFQKMERTLFRGLIK